MTAGPANPERSFGISVGTVLVVIAAFLWWRGRIVRGEVVGGIGAVLFVFGIVYPPLLKHPAALWFRFSRTLGHVNARVLLTVLFALVLTPVGLVWRMTGKDPLGRSRDRWPGWTPYPERYRDPKHYSRMF
jgi:saxitoxin biosynthesis operon SxtJ-like protein